MLQKLPATLVYNCQLIENVTAADKQGKEAIKVQHQFMLDRYQKCKQSKEVSID